MKRREASKPSVPLPLQFRLGLLEGEGRSGVCRLTWAPPSLSALPPPFHGLCFLAFLFFVFRGHPPACRTPRRVGRYAVVFFSYLL